ncbi:MAG: site-specific DNA-methyltransferase [Alphaproteobacteria bacterium]|nr:site-specific DNA-methyltransferase [Alphaproteobacteria bacterium]
MIHNEDCLSTIHGMEDGSIDLVFTSPPYFNARPEYATYDDYHGYIEFMERVITGLHRVTAEGRYVVINTSPVLVPRKDRNDKSRRYNIPAHLNQIAEAAGFEFIDDIIWKKPFGAGCGRNKKFAQLRTPLYYHAEAITEYLMVYRTHTRHLPEWNVRKYDDEIVRSSAITEYEPGNVWEFNPEQDSPHPAAFPPGLARRVISLYSFRGDIVYDPFMGSGTTAVAAKSLGRRWVGSEIHPEYCRMAGERLAQEVLV